MFIPKKLRTCTCGRWALSDSVFVSCSPIRMSAQTSSWSVSTVEGIGEQELISEGSSVSKWSRQLFVALLHRVGLETWFDRLKEARKYSQWRRWECCLSRVFALKSPVSTNRKSAPCLVWVASATSTVSERHAQEETGADGVRETQLKRIFLRCPGNSTNTVSTFLDTVLLVSRNLDPTHGYGLAKIHRDPATTASSISILPHKAVSIYLDLLVENVRADWCLSSGRECPSAQPQVCIEHLRLCFEAFWRSKFRVWGLRRSGAGEEDSLPRCPEHSLFNVDKGAMKWVKVSVLHVSYFLKENCTPKS